MTRINVGCGPTPTEGWVNYDNSMSVRLAWMLGAGRVLQRVPLLREPQRRFISLARVLDVRYANAVRRIPQPTASVEVLYSSHMLEHLDPQEAASFLREARRVLKPGGVIRIAVPDLRYHVDNYLDSGDANALIEGTLLTKNRPRRFAEKVAYLAIGDRHHQWMYDGESLCGLLNSAGFLTPKVMEAGTTMIIGPGKLNLSERSPESVFVEALNP